VGGRIEPGESLEQAVVREFREETGAQARILRLVYFHENFFYRDPAGAVHEFGWYFWVDSDRPIGRPGISAPHPDSERLSLEYVELARLAVEGVVPPFLAEVLAGDVAAGFASAPRHLISHEEADGASRTREALWLGGVSEAEARVSEVQSHGSRRRGRSSKTARSDRRRPAKAKR
jgi:ADP-ribose pyrophosphatase YjhB (NUDIX family)